MSYCRWTDDSDVYVYEDASGGWTTHVAGRRRIDPPPGPSLELLRDGQVFWYLMLDRMSDSAREVTGDPMEDLAAPSAGKSFNDPTPGECADRLEALRAEGLMVPQYAIDDLREEAREG